MYGLIGKKLQHSFSKKIFDEHFKNTFNFKLIELDSISELPKFIELHENLKGFSVTIPYKTDIIKYLSYIEPKAKKINAVNTVKIIRENNTIKLNGYNTDVDGFLDAYSSLFPKNSQYALVLGSGGASKAVCYALNSLGIKTLIATRNNTHNNNINYSEIDQKIISECKIIVNATPLGMFPNVQGYPNINYSFLTSQHLAIDLTYNPEITAFMQKSQEFKANVINGYKMLEQQAEYAWKIWNI